MKERSVFIIKPNAVAAGVEDDILHRISDAGFEIIRTETMRLTRRNAEEFYAEHRGKPFYAELLDFMTSGPIVAGTVEKDDAVNSLRRLVGATNPKEAAEGTIRRLYGIDITRNAIHASDSPASAMREERILFR